MRRIVSLAVVVLVVAFVLTQVSRAEDPVAHYNQVIIPRLIESAKKHGMKVNTIPRIVVIDAVTWAYRKGLTDYQQANRWSKPPPVGTWNERIQKNYLERLAFICFIKDLGGVVKSSGYALALSRKSKFLVRGAYNQLVGDLSINNYAYAALKRPVRKIVRVCYHVKGVRGARCKITVKYKKRKLVLDRNAANKIYDLRGIKAGQMFLVR